MFYHSRGNEENKQLFIYMLCTLHKTTGTVLLKAVLSSEQQDITDRNQEKQI
jgi:hypothetical protein